MLYITLDTCIWLNLLKIGLHNDNNEFEEICYWIENKHLTHITPQNIIREWDKNKDKKQREIRNDIKTLNNNIFGSFRGTPDLISAYQPDIIEEIVSKRVERVDKILKIHSEIAHETTNIYDEAINRNFNYLAPNYSKDSFRDTINILTIINYLKIKGYTNSIFSTNNYLDFSEGKLNKHILQKELVDLFDDANLQYVYCDEEPFASKLLGYNLRPFLANFQDYLIDKKKEESEKIMIERKVMTNSNKTNPDIDFLINIKYIDMILSNVRPTNFELFVLQNLINSHDSYKQYFLKNIGNNGLV